MEEGPLFPLKSLFSLLRVAAFIVILALFIAVMTMTSVNIYENQIKRSNVEIADTILHSGLAIPEQLVFDKAKLDIYKGTRTEPYARHCNLAYRVRIEDLATKETWEFGYKPDSDDVKFSIDESKAEGEYPAAISIPAKDANYYDTVSPAKMTLTVYDTWLTRISCLAEKAYTLKRPQEMRVPCLAPLLHYGGSRGGEAGCGMPIRKMNNNMNSNFICYYKDKDADCRYLPDVPVFDFNYRYKKEGDYKSLKALPIKQGIALSRTGLCNAISSDYIAQPGDAVAGVALCIE